MDLVLTEAELPLRLRLETPLSDWELLRFSGDNHPMRVEREPDGEITVMSPTGSEGGSQELEVATELIIWARQDGRGKAFGSNAGFTLPDTSIRAAGASWVSFSRWNALTPEQRKGFAPLCPEFVIELRSPSDRLPTLQAKMEQWIANGAELAWLIDPERENSCRFVGAMRLPRSISTQPPVQGTGPIHGFNLVLSRI